jgi:hypothetical protein
MNREQLKSRGEANDANNAIGTDASPLVVLGKRATKEIEYVNKGDE